MLFATIAVALGIVLARGGQHEDLRAVVAEVTNTPTQIELPALPLYVGEPVHADTGANETPEESPLWEPTPVPIATQIPISESQVGIHEIICSVDWPCESAKQVADCESTDNPAATSPGGHRGLFQIASVHLGRILNMGYIWDDMLTAWANVRVAYAIWSEQGWQPWSCKPW